MADTTTTDTKLLDCLEFNPNNDPLASIIRLHGLGADGYDFEPVIVKGRDLRLLSSSSGAIDICPSYRRTKCR
jgi:predicted esterase